MDGKRQPGGIVKAEGLGDGSTHGKVTIATLRLGPPNAIHRVWDPWTMPPTMRSDFAFALLSGGLPMPHQACILYNPNGNERNRLITAMPLVVPSQKNYDGHNANLSE